MRRRHLIAPAREEGGRLAEDVALGEALEEAAGEALGESDMSLQITNTIGPRRLADGEVDLHAGRSRLREEDEARAGVAAESASTSRVSGLGSTDTMGPRPARSSSPRASPLYSLEPRLRRTTERA